MVSFVWSLKKFDSDFWFCVVYRINIYTFIQQYLTVLFSSFYLASLNLF